MEVVTAYFEARVGELTKASDAGWTPAVLYLLPLKLITRALGHKVRTRLRDVQHALRGRDDADEGRR